ncbi:hypothetical protein RRG08_058045 [Elysia crispata]|uniref:Uncharacterized protein n=1 Tax=Elysia crispata TaxID=231223 RepID=A0AAE1DTZ4_9GAST|nr:hypothetical protein RRG08_058045 [Elysia crispata]
MDPILPQRHHRYYLSCILLHPHRGHYPSTSSLWTLSFNILIMDTILQHPHYGHYPSTVSSLTLSFHILITDTILPHPH